MWWLESWLVLIARHWRGTSRCPQWPTSPLISSRVELPICRHAVYCALRCSRWWNNRCLIGIFHKSERRRNRDLERNEKWYEFSDGWIGGPSRIAKCCGWPQYLIVVCFSIIKTTRRGSEWTSANCKWHFRNENLPFWLEPGTLFCT